MRELLLDWGHMASMGYRLLFFSLGGERRNTHAQGHADKPRQGDCAYFTATIAFSDCSHALCLSADVAS
jgi:hypothetical protein